MDIKKYISSGILELYVLDMLSAVQRQEVEQYLLKYPELRTEVDKIERSLEIYADSHKLKADGGLEQRIMAEIAQVSQEKKIEPKDQDDKKTGGWLGFLLGFLLLVALGSIFWMNNQKQEIQSNLNAQTGTLQQLQDDCAEKDTELNELRNQIDILLDTNIKQVPLAGVNIGPETAKAVVYYDQQDRKSYFNIGNLAPAPTNQQYQLWALVDGNPVDMGFVQVSSDGDTTIIEVPFVENPGAFAITLEFDDGDPAPNLDQLYVYGENS